METLSPEDLLPVTGLLELPTLTPQQTFIPLTLQEQVQAFLDEYNALSQKHGLGFSIRQTSKTRMDMTVVESELIVVPKQR